MFIQILIGSITILLTMAVMVGFVGVSIRFCHRLEQHFDDGHTWNKSLFASLSAAVIMVLSANTICIWIWATLLRILNVFPTFESAVYFSLISFTTVGYGDLVAEESWRVLTAFVSINGLLAFGIFTAFMIQVISQSTDQSK
ncbi:MAG: potassium channel family protein [Pseudomonadota bacterium]